jgi:exodeoxyribonuclease VIII
MKIITDIPNAEYHATPAISSTGLKLMQRSPAHYYARYLDPQREPDEPTPAMKMGTAWHTAIFEPHLLEKTCVQIPEGLDRRTKEGKQLYADMTAGGREPFSFDDYNRITAMAAAARQHPAVRVIFDLPGGAAEQSIFCADEETGAPCKIRPDYAVAPCAMFPHGLLVDGKSTENASAEEFPRQAWNLGMFLQAAFYVDIYQRAMGTAKPPVFAWVAQEKAAPYATAVYSASDDLLEFGRRQYRPLVAKWAACMASGVWPAYPTLVQPMALPGWAERAVQEKVAA